MLPRILSHIIFWILMTCLIAGALVVVPFLYLPFVVLKAVVLAVTGKIGDVTGRPRRKPEPAGQQFGLPG